MKNWESELKKLGIKKKKVDFQTITKDLVKKKYRKKVLVYHPDKGKEKDSTKFVNISNAYEYIMENWDMMYRDITGDYIEKVDISKIKEYEIERKLQGKFQGNSKENSKENSKNFSEIVYMISEKKDKTKTKILEIKEDQIKEGMKRYKDIKGITERYKRKRGMLEIIGDYFE